MTIAPRAFASGTGANDAAVTIPASVQTGDAMFIVAMNNVDSNFTTPAGWDIAKAKESSEAGGECAIVYKRIAQAGDANSSVNVHNDGEAGSKAITLLGAYSGTDNVDPVHVIQSLLSTGGSSSINTPAVNTTEDGCFIIQVMCGKSSSSTVISGKPAGTTTRLTVIGTGGGHSDGCWVDQGPVDAGAYGSGTFTADATYSSGIGYTIAVKAKSTTQTLRPATDVAVDGYTAVPAPGTGVAMSARIGESVRDDATYIATPSNPDAAVFETRLSAGLDPLSSADHKISVVLSTAGGAVSSSCQVDLVQGTTVIATETFTDIPDTPTVYDFTLSTGEADSITDYSDLRLRFTWTVS